jgi:hypothetical protein
MTTCAGAWAARLKSDGCEEYIVQVVTEIALEGDELLGKLPEAKKVSERTLVEGFALDDRQISIRVDSHATTFGLPRPSGATARSRFGIISACCGNYKGLTIPADGYRLFSVVPKIGDVKDVNCKGPVTHYMWQMRGDVGRAHYFKVEVPTGTTLYED